MGLVCWWSHRDSKDSLKKFCRDSTWDNLAVARRFQDPPRGWLGAPTWKYENPNLEMPHTFWTLYIALTKKKCKKGKCNEKVSFHYKLWIEVPSFQTCLDGQKLQNNVELLNLSTSVLGTPWLRRSPWKLEILDMPWTQIRSNLAVWIPSGCGGSILQVCKSRRETAFTATHMFGIQPSTKV